VFRHEGIAQPLDFELQDFELPLGAGRVGCGIGGFHNAGGLDGLMSAEGGGEAFQAVSGPHRPVGVSFAQAFPDFLDQGGRILEKELNHLLK
jgi:hypothetical protein